MVEAMGSQEENAHGPETNSIGMDVIAQTKKAQERGPPPTNRSRLPPPFINKMGFVRMHEETAAQQKKRDKPPKRGKAQVYVRQTMRPHVLHGPAPSILTLKATTLREVAMNVNHIHEQSILFGKTIYAAHRLVGTNLLVEDDIGDCLLFSLYNFVPDNEDPNEYFPEGTYLAILAPYMKNSGDDPERNLLLRCDNPECVRIFPSRRSWLAAKKGKKLVDTEGLNPNQLRMEGNDAFREGRYETAARLYSRALACENITEEDQLACHGNLAEVRIRKQQWEEAETHATSALKLDCSHAKAMYRLATAQIRLNKILEASNLIAEEKGKEFQKLKEDITRLLLEQQGLYDLAAMKKEAYRRPRQVLETFHSNYTSPKIQRCVDISKRASFKYRGTLANEKIGSNTLVSSSKALVFCSSPPFATTHGYSIDPYSKQVLKGSSMELENELISLMHRRPEIRPIVYSLASECGEVVDGGADDGKIDIKRAHRVMTSNTFAVVSGEEVEQAWEHHQHLQKSREPMDDEVSSGSGLCELDLTMFACFALPL